MEILQFGAILLIFLAMTLLMFYRILPALLALPLMAIAIAFAGGVQPDDIGQYVVGKGALKLSGAYTIAMFGGMLSLLLQKTKIAESFIKKGAELSGDNPWVISVVMFLFILMLFSTLGGLGAIIMVATIVLPVLSSVGVSPLASVGIFLLGVSIGGTLNVGNWALFTGLGLEIEQIRPFAMYMFGIGLTVSLVYITLQLYFDGHDINLKKVAQKTVLTVGLLLSLIWLYHYILPPTTVALIKVWFTLFMQGLKFSLALLLLFAWLAVAWRAALKKNTDEVHWLSFLTPLIPLILILAFDFNFIAAFMLALFYAYLATWQPGRLNLFLQSCMEGASSVMPAVILMFGIGMILVAIMGPGGTLEHYPDGNWPVLGVIKPYMSRVIPTHPFSYVLGFGLMAPLALYRGPLNLWGMGYGLAGVFIASGLSPAVVMGLLMSVGQVQGISDPTNTQNVWLANEMQVNVQKVLWNTLPYAWGIALLGLICSAVTFMI